MKPAAVLFALAGLCLGIITKADTSPVPNTPNPSFADLAYVENGHAQQRLDLYLPTGPGPHPLIVFVHGGAWRSGSKTEMPLAPLVAQGFAIASVDYRLSPVARFPAQVQDIKAAIRFLRGHAADYHLDPRRFALAGTSAGGHLAALAGLAHDQPELEGILGEHLDQSSAVQAIVSLYGGSDLTTILAQSTPAGLKMRVPALDLLLGGQPDASPALNRLARLASPVFQVDAQSPPLLLFHGDADPQMPVGQARELHARYEELHLPVELHLLPGAGHGGPVFSDAPRLEIIRTFLEKHFAAANPSRSPRDYPGTTLP